MWWAHSCSLVEGAQWCRTEAACHSQRQCQPATLEARPSASSSFQTVALAGHLICNVTRESEPEHQLLPGAQLSETVRWHVYCFRRLSFEMIPYMAKITNTRREECSTLYNEHQRVDISSPRFLAISAGACDLHWANQMLVSKMVNLRTRNRAEPSGELIPSVGAATVVNGIFCWQQWE